MDGRRSSGQSGGMTLIEVLVAVGISSLVLLVIGGLLMFGRQMDRRARSSQGLAEISFAMQHLTGELRETSRHPDAVQIWEAGVPGVRRKVVGVLSARVRTGDSQGTASASAGPRWTGWVYFVYDPALGELRRLDHLGPSTSTPSFESARVLARNVSRFDVVRNRDVFTITVAGTKDGQTVRLVTDIWPRNE